MTEFMILYIAHVMAEEQMKVSPEEMERGMEPWNLAWYKKWGKAIVDNGTPLGKGIHFTKRVVPKLNQK